jgi:hypothetical protein
MFPFLFRSLGEKFGETRQCHIRPGKVLRLQTYAPDIRSENLSNPFKTNTKQRSKFISNQMLTILLR